MEVKLETYNKLASIIDAEDGLTVESMQRLSLATNSLVRIAESDDAEQIPYQLYYDIEDKLEAKEADIQSLLDSVATNEALSYTMDAIDNKIQEKRLESFLGFNF